MKMRLKLKSIINHKFGGWVEQRERTKVCQTKANKGHFSLSNNNRITHRCQTHRLKGKRITHDTRHIRSELTTISNRQDLHTCQGEEERRCVQDNGGGSFDNRSAVMTPAMTGCPATHHEPTTIVVCINPPPPTSTTKVLQVNVHVTQ